MTFEEVDRVEEQVCRWGKYDPDDLILVNLIYLGKGVE